MRDRHALPVADHVARRETTRAGGRLHELHAAWSTLIDEIVIPVDDAFARGDRLSGADYARFVAKARSVMEGLDPVLLVEASRGPTRTRPKGEEHEFRMVARSGKVYPGGGVIANLDGIRLHIGRKRLEMDYQLGGISVSGHLLERVIQRNMVAWDGRFREIDRGVHGLAGLVVLWVHALDAVLLPTAEVAFPLGDGLMLGSLTMKAEDTGTRVQCGRSGLVSHNVAGHPVLRPPNMPELGNMGCVHFVTAVNEDMLNIEQVDLRDGLLAFAERERDLLDKLGEAVFWRDCRLAPSHAYADLAPRIHGATQRLVDFLRRPDIDRGLRAGKPDLPRIEPEIEGLVLGARR